MDHDGIKWELQISRQKCDDTLNMIEESTGKIEFSRNLLHLLTDVCHTSMLQGFFTSFPVVGIAIPYNRLAVWQKLRTPLIGLKHINIKDDKENPLS